MTQLMEFIIDENYHGVRVDRFLRKMLPNTPLTEIFKALRVGNIKLNGKKTKENARLNKGDILKVFKIVSSNSDSISDEKKEFVSLSKEEIAIIKSGIVYEDEFMLIFNKPYGLVMHCGSGHDYGLTEMVESYLKNKDFSFVNRIDKETSGLVIGAKTLPRARELSEEIRENRIDKRYYILVDGIIKNSSFKKVSFLKKLEDKVVELEKFEEGAKESITEFKVVERFQKHTLLIGKLYSGRTHQLRVQLSSMGFPIVGDRKYNSKTNSKRMMLHSFYLEIPRFKLKLEIPCPKEFKII